MSEQKHILIVDDESDIRTLLQGMLAKYQTTCAKDVDEALEILNHQSFDLIISDIRMPGKTGEDFLCIAQQRGISTPFIFITGHMDSGHRISELKQVAFDCITKPFRMRVLLDVVDRAFTG